MPKLGADGKYIIKIEDLYDGGKARAIGASNWTIPRLEPILKQARIIPAVNQMEIHPFLPNTKLVDYYLNKGIMPEAYSPLGSQNQLPSTGEKVNKNAELNRIAEKGANMLA
ncbi:MAG: hypothetical protein M1827_004317 [Pycnora praestabilis]|nr:MAG: hypothetical protein M1827_004317 [Pycnora praestabilis]